MSETVTLYRPTGPEEMGLLRASGFLRWPPRLAEQPIFYPVTNEQYAIEIAQRWNIKDSGVGYVTRFQVREAFMQHYAAASAAQMMPFWVTSAPTLLTPSRRTSRSRSASAARHYISSPPATKASAATTVSTTALRQGSKQPLCVGA